MFIGENKIFEEVLLYCHVKEPLWHTYVDVFIFKTMRLGTLWLTVEVASDI